MLDHDSHWTRRRYLESSITMLLAATLSFGCTETEPTSTLDAAVADITSPVDASVAESTRDAFVLGSDGPVADTKDPIAEQGIPDLPVGGEPACTPPCCYPGLGPASSCVPYDVNMACCLGTCSLNGTCLLWPGETGCTSDEECSRGTCDAQGRCVLTEGENCWGNDDACSSQFCLQGKCAARCSPSGEACSDAGDCCSGSCSGVCDPPRCPAFGEACYDGVICATGLACDGAKCCKLSGNNACQQDAECCSGDCKNGYCAGFCWSSGCSVDGDCCSGYCVSGSCQVAPYLDFPCGGDQDCCGSTRCSGGRCVEW